MFREDGLLSLQRVPDFTDPTKTVDQYGVDWFEGAIARPGQVRACAASTWGQLGRRSAMRLRRGGASQGSSGRQLAPAPAMPTRVFSN